MSLGAPWPVYDETAVGSWIGSEPALLRKAHHSVSRCPASASVRRH
ncbi:hypothetical protein [Streptomyces canus]